MQPKITQRLLLRSAIGLLVLAGLFMAFRWYREREADLHGEDKLATAGWLAALEETEQGQHVVAIKPDGSIVRQSDVPAESEDRDVVWRPDGNFLFFSSNRTKGRFTMFRWFPDGSSPAEQRSVGGRIQEAPSFLLSDADKGSDAHALVTAGGVVMEYDPKKPAFHQTLPPPDPKKEEQIDEEGSGRKSAFEGEYEHFGTSFRCAKWTPDKSAVFAVMRRETGEILIYQRLTAPDPNELRPRAIVAGDRIDFDVDQKKGIVYFTVQNFQWTDPENAPQQFRKGNRVTVPFKHAIGMVDMSQQQPMQFILESNDDKVSFAEPTISPSADAIAFVAGPYQGSGNLTPTGLFVAPPQPGLKSLAPAIVSGEVHEPTWGPDGNMIAFAKRDSKTSRPIYTIERSDPVPRRRSPDGVFSNPTFSPQAAK